MNDPITNERLQEYLAFSIGEEDDEMVSILTELQKRRRESSYSREQRLSFMLRIVKDAFPEIAKELREIYQDQENNAYYLRRHLEDWQRRCHALEEQLQPKLKGRPSSGGLEGND